MQPLLPLNQQRTHGSATALVSTAIDLLSPTLVQDYDVYVAEREPLKEGENKHVVSVFVADESGLINRVAGVFARRGVLLPASLPQAVSQPVSHVAESHVDTTVGPHRNMRLLGILTQEFQYVSILNQP